MVIISNFPIFYMLKVHLLNNDPQAFTADQLKDFPHINIANPEARRQGILELYEKQAAKGKKPKPPKNRGPEIPLALGGEYALADKPATKYRYIGTIAENDVQRFIMATDSHRSNYRQELQRAMRNYLSAGSQDELEPGHQTPVKNTFRELLDEDDFVLARRLFVFQNGPDRFLITTSTRGLTRLE
jgi:hypothetical protein